jgi:hypothetical protein
VTVETVLMADHLLAGATAQVAQAVTAWVVDRVEPERGVRRGAR